MTIRSLPDLTSASYPPTHNQEGGSTLRTSGPGHRLPYPQPSPEHRVLLPRLRPHTRHQYSQAQQDRPVIGQQIFGSQDLDTKSLSRNPHQSQGPSVPTGRTPKLLCCVGPHREPQCAVPGGRRGSWVLCHRLFTRALYSEKLRTAATAVPTATSTPLSQKEVGCSSVCTRCL